MSPQKKATRANAVERLNQLVCELRALATSCRHMAHLARVAEKEVACVSSYGRGRADALALIAQELDRFIMAMENGGGR
jgi:hypothetical protein